MLESVDGTWPSASIRNPAPTKSCFYLCFFISLPFAHQHGARCQAREAVARGLHQQQDEDTALTRSLFSTQSVCAVPFNTQDLGAKIAEELRRNGAVIVSDVFSAAECTARCAGILEGFKRLNPENLLVHDAGTWTAANLPPQVRSGLFQGVVCNLPDVWAVRADERVSRVFQEAYGALRGSPQREMFTSIDGINMRMPSEKTWHQQEKTKDWAHVDQTDPSNPFKCIQGQVVLRGDSACFVCSPGSHLALKEVLKDAGVAPSDKSNWCKFEQERYPAIQARVRNVGGLWQTPVQAPAGSMILWLSSTIHSAKIQDRSDDTMRCVVYVCQRPKTECGATPAQRKKHAERLRRCIEENRATNHWGDRLFPKGSRYPLHEDTPHALRAVIENPERLYDLTGKVQITPAIEALISAVP